MAVHKKKSFKIFEKFITVLPKKHLPKKIDWDEKYYEQFGEIKGDIVQDIFLMVQEYFKKYPKGKAMSIKELDKITNKNH